MGRDPIGYEGSKFGLYEAIRGRVLIYLDPTGLIPITCTCHGYSPRDAGGGPYTIYRKINCQGLATSCCPQACGQDRWDGEWYVGEPPNPVIPRPLTLNDCAIAGAACITVDLATPDPTDLCPPKYVCYAIAGCVAATIIYCGKDGDELDDMQEALDSFRSNADFRRWWHKEYKGDQGMSGGGQNQPRHVQGRYIRRFQRVG